LADSVGVPPYVVFPDRTLGELARRKPRTLEAMAGIFGVGERKLARYGEDFLAVIRASAGDD
jgi:ATP-dependent DNA helicase RecQ